MLYAIQGTGNGHISRAADIIPVLRQYGELDLMVSGAQADLSLPFPVKFKSKGLSFYFGKGGGINFIKTFKNNRSQDVIREIKKFPIEKYDLVINDFEPITAWAARKREVPIIAFGHQAAFRSKKTPRPKVTDPLGEWLLKHYAPFKKYVGFHFKEYDKNIFTPVIRSSIRKAFSKNKDHYTVYLPAYDDKKLVKHLFTFKNIRWHIFSKHSNKPYHVGKVSVFPISNSGFVESMISAQGILCGAGFETPAEVLFLNKKLLVVPMKAQYEQKCNALALRKLGVPVIKKVKRKAIHKIEKWIESKYDVEVNYNDNVADAVEALMAKAKEELGITV